MSCTNCLITTAIPKGCRDNVGGLKNVYVLAGEISGITQSSTGIVSSMSGSGTWYQYVLERNTSSYTETITPSLENGTVFYQQDVLMVFNLMRQSLTKQFQTLAQCTELRLIVETNQGTFFLLGKDFGMAVSAGTAGSGLAFGDRNGYSLTVTGFERDPGPALDTSLELSQILTNFTIVSV